MITGKEWDVARKAVGKPETEWGEFRETFTPEVVVEMIDEMQKLFEESHELAQHYIDANKVIIAQYRKLNPSG